MKPYLEIKAHSDLEDSRSLLLLDYGMLKIKGENELAIQLLFSIPEEISSSSMQPDSIEINIIDVEVFNIKERIAYTGISAVSKTLPR